MGNAPTPAPVGKTAESSQPNTPKLPSAANSPTPPPPTSRPESQADQARAEKMREFVRGLDRRLGGSLDKSLRDSGAMKRMTDRLGNVDWSRISKSKSMPDNWASRLDLAKRTQGTGRLFERTIDKFEGRRMPNVGKLPD